MPNTALHISSVIAYFFSLAKAGQKTPDMLAFTQGPKNACIQISTPVVTKSSKQNHTKLQGNFVTYFVCEVNDKVEKYLKSEEL